MSNNSGSKFSLVVGTLVVGILISGFGYFAYFNRPTEKVEDIRNDVRKIKISFVVIICLGVGYGLGRLFGF